MGLYFEGVMTLLIGLSGCWPVRSGCCSVSRKKGPNPAGWAVFVAVIWFIAFPFYL